MQLTLQWSMWPKANHFVMCNDWTHFHYFVFVYIYAGADDAETFFSQLQSRVLIYSRICVWVSPEQRIPGTVGQGPKKMPGHFSAHNSVTSSSESMMNTKRDFFSSVFFCPRVSLLPWPAVLVVFVSALKSSNSIHLQKWKYHFL